MTAFAGVGPNKLVAKIASDFQKPNGLTVVPPPQVLEFLKDLPIRKIPGIGPRTESICWSYGIKKISDFLKYDDDILIEWFGKAGVVYKLSAQGIDDRLLITQWERKSCGIEDTFEFDLRSKEEAIKRLQDLSMKLEKRLADEGCAGEPLCSKLNITIFDKLLGEKR